MEKIGEQLSKIRDELYDYNLSKTPVNFKVIKYGLELAVYILLIIYIIQQL